MGRNYPKRFTSTKDCRKCPLSLLNVKLKEIDRKFLVTFREAPAFYLTFLEKQFFFCCFHSSHLCILNAFRFYFSRGVFGL